VSRERILQIQEKIEKTVKGWPKDEIPYFEEEHSDLIS
jgi:hypothetical protein